MAMAFSMMIQIGGYCFDLGIFKVRFRHYVGVVLRPITFAGKKEALMAQTLQNFYPFDHFQRNAIGSGQAG
jgi:hypothetical protein